MQSPGGKRFAVGLRELRAICQPSEKVATRTLRSRLLYQPFSIYITAACVRLGVTANQVTLIGIGAVIAGTLLVAGGPHPALRLAGMAFFNLHHLLDIVDGEIVRYGRSRGQMRATLRGAFLDLLSHYLAQPAMISALGISLLWGSGTWGPVIGVMIVVSCLGVLGLPTLVSSAVIKDSLQRNPARLDDPLIRQILTQVRSSAHDQTRTTTRWGRVSSLLIFPGLVINLTIIAVADLVFSVLGLASAATLMKIIVVALYAALFCASFVRTSIREFDVLRRAETPLDEQSS